MADLALALAKPAAASPIAAMLVTTPTKGAVPAAATDPFAILMAAASPPAPTTLTVSQLREEPKFAAVAEKTGDGETAKDDGDKPTDPDALLALLTTPAPLAAPVPLAQPIVAAAPATPVSDTPQAPIAKAVTPIALPAIVAQPSAPVADAVPIAQTTQTSIQALVQMMTAQTDPVVAAQPIAAQALGQAGAEPTTVPPIAAQIAMQTAVASTDDAAPAIVAQAAPALAVAETKPLTRANARFLAPRLDGARAANAKAQPEVRAAKAEVEPKSQRRDDRDAPHIDTAAVQPQQQDSKADSRETVTVTTKASDIGSPEAVVTRHLAVAKDGQWLDSLARDIAATGGTNSSLSFMLSPENLGALKVDITQGSEGASVHMTTDNDNARNIILDAQPRLAAEARAQGLTLKETSVSTNSDQQRHAPAQQQASAQSNQQQPGQDRRAFAQAAQQPTAPTFSSPADESDGELYA